MNDDSALVGPVVFFTGAGISVGAGLPTYRGTGGLYTSSTAQPPSVDDITPDRLPALWERFRPRVQAYDDLRPSVAHSAIAALEESASDEVVVVTQNVDGLHSLAGSTRVIELHGSLRRVECLDYGHAFDLVDVPWPAGQAPQCPTCASICRPSIVLFGEQLPPGAFTEAAEAVRRARTIVAVGTSAVVYPAALLIAPENVAGMRAFWINPETEPPDLSWRWLRGSADDRVPSLHWANGT